MNYVQQIFICATFCLAIVDYGSLAENSVSKKKNSTHSITTVGNILTPLLLKQVEKRLMNHTAISDGVISIENIDSSTPMNIDTITTNFELKENQKSSNSPIKKLKSTTTIPTTILFPADRVKINPELIVKDKLEIDSARAQQRQLESQFPFNFRNQFNVDYQDVGRQSNGANFGNSDSFNSNQFHFFNPLDEQKSNDDIVGIQNIRNSQFPARNSILNDPNRPVNSQILPLDFRRFQNFDNIRYDGRYFDSNQFINPNYRTEADFKGKIGVETGSRGGIVTDIAGLADRYNNLDNQQYFQNNLPLQYRQNLRNNVLNSVINNQATNAVNNNQPITPLINNQDIPIGLPFRSYTNPYLTSENVNTNVDPFSQEFQNNFPDTKNSQQRYNYSPIPSRLLFPGHSGNVMSSGSITSINSQISNTDNDNNDGITSSSLISSRRSEDFTIEPTTNTEKVITKIPVVESIRDRKKLFFPQQDDYSDIRISSNFFKQHILESKILEKYAKTNVI